MSGKIFVQCHTIIDVKCKLEAHYPKVIFQWINFKFFLEYKWKNFIEIFFQYLTILDILS